MPVVKKPLSPVTPPQPSVNGSQEYGKDIHLLHPEVSPGFARNEVREEGIAEAGLTWEIRGISTERDIDWNWTASNFTRMDRRLDRETIDDYAQAQKEYLRAFQEGTLADGGGRPFPMPIAVPRPNDKVGIVAGVRTTTATRPRKITIPCYYVEPQSTHQFAILATWDNRIQGDRMTRSQAVGLAAHLVEQEGMHIKDAAREMHIPKGLLSERLSAWRMQRTLAGLGFVKELSDTHLRSLRLLEGNTNVLKAVAEYVYRAGLTAEATGLFRREVMKFRTEGEQLDFVSARLAEFVSRERSGRPLVTKRTRFYRALAAFRSCLESLDLSRIEDLDITRGSDEHKQLKKAITGDLFKILRKAVC